MPVFSRKQLRRDLARRYIHDYAVSNAEVYGQNAGAQTQFLPVTMMSTMAANPAFSGQDMYQNAWLYVEGSIAIGDTGPSLFQYMIASYNAASGAFISLQLAKEWHSNTANFEVHTRVPPYDKDRAIDSVIQRIRLRQEVGINTIDGALVYTIDGAASPYMIDRILNIHIAANPSNSQNLDIRHVSDWDVVPTATGNVLRLTYAVQGSQQLLLDAILAPTLGVDTATINIPDERWILAGAAVTCYDLLIQDAPGQQVQQLQQRRAEHAAEFSRLTTRFAPAYAEPIRLHDIVRGAGNYPGNGVGWNMW